MTTIAEALTGLPAPDDVGQSEYRLLRGFVDDVLSGAEGEEDHERALLVIVSMDEVIDTARMIRAAFLSTTFPSKEFQLAGILDELSAAVERAIGMIENDAAQAARREAMLIHMKLERTQKDIDALPDTDGRTYLSGEVKTLFGRLFMEVFGFTAEEIAKGTETT